MIAVITFFDSLTQTLATGYWIKAISAIHEVAASEATRVDFIDRGALVNLGASKIIERYQGVIAAVPQRSEARRLWRALERRLPAVAIMSMPTPEPRAFVGTDDALAIRKILAHLVDEGHRSILYAGLRLEPYARLRQTAFLQCRLPQIRSRKALDFSSFYEKHGAYAPNFAAEGLVAEQRVGRYDALVFESDFFASRFMAAAERAGLSIPGDLGVAGIDDNPEYPLSVPLTTIRHDGASLGRSAARLLFARIRGERGGGRVLIEPSLVIRRSSLRDSLNADDDAAFRRFTEDRIREWRASPELLRTLPATLGMSRPRFSRRFSKIFRTNFVAYVNRERIAAAEREIAATDDGITSIALEAGFNNHTNFMKFFRRSYGCTPTAYRERIRKGASHAK